MSERASVGTDRAGEPTTQHARAVRKIVIDLTIMTVVGVLLALIGPFGSFEAPLSVRLISWVGLSWVGYAVYSPMGIVVARLHRSLDLPTAALWIAAALVATVPMAIITWIIGRLPGPIAVPDSEMALTHYLYVLVIGGAITALMFALERNTFSDIANRPKDRGAAAQEPATIPKPPAAIPFLDRLPPELGSDLLALEMEDHYVRAHTTLGSDLVLMRLRDAVAELSGLEGAQVHRSWWVARAAVEDVRREGRNIRLVLPDGLEAPVSRARIEELKAAGWL